jgi:hypothetical protein
VDVGSVTSKTLYTEAAHTSKTKATLPTYICCKNPTAKSTSTLYSENFYFVDQFHSSALHGDGALLDVRCIRILLMNQHA